MMLPAGRDSSPWFRVQAFSVWGFDFRFGFLLFRSDGTVDSKTEASSKEAFAPPSLYRSFLDEE